MKILLINVVFGYGSTGVIVKNLCEEYKANGHEVYVLCRKKKIRNDRNKNIKKTTFELESKFCHFLSKYTGNLYGGMFFSTKKAMHLIKKIKPDVVHLHCLNGFFVNIYTLLTFLKRRHIKTILTNHAEFMLTANCGYSLNCDKWKNNECLGCERVPEFVGAHSLNRTHKYFLKMKKALNGFDTLKVTGVSPWLTARIKQSPLYKNVQIDTILNPVCLNTYIGGDNPYLGNLKATNKNRVALFVCNQINNNEKGFDKFIELAKLMNDSNYLFALVGNDFDFKSLGINAVSFGAVDNNLLAKFYKFADVTLLLSKKETFSMVVAESLISGTPVVGFMSGGPESITIQDYSHFVRYGDLSAICSILNEEQYLLSSGEKLKANEKAINKYSIKVIAEQYLKLWS